MAIISELKFSAADMVAFNAEESARTLTYTVMHKLRLALVRMGLTKNHHEPIGPAVTAFDALRRKIQEKLAKDAKHVSTHGPEGSQQILQFWGIQNGKPVPGEFDKLLNGAIASAENLPVNDRVSILQSIRV